MSSVLNVRVPSNISGIDLLLPCPPRACTQSSSVRAFKGLLSCSAPSCVITWPDPRDKASLAGTKPGSDPDVAQSPSRSWVITWQSHPYHEAAIPPSATHFSKHLRAFSFPDKGQSCGTGLWAGASCKSISLTSSLLKKLDIRALRTANLLLSLPPEKWIILMLTEGFSFFKSCQI